MRPSPTESVEATENAPLSAAAEPRSPIRVGDRHPAAQGRIGQQLHEEGHVAEVAFETGRSVQRFGVEEVLRPAVGGEVEVSGRRYVETIRPMSARVPAAVSFTRTVRSFSAGGIAAG